MEIAVTNTSSIIFIAKLNLFYLAKNIFSKILIPKQVIEEILSKEGPENLIIEKELNGFLEGTEATKIKDFSLDKGERTAISLCLEKNIKIFISDDKKARTYARNLGINTIGVIGIILKNLELNKLKKQEAKTLINKLIEKGYYLSSNYYVKIIEEIEKF